MGAIVRFLSVSILLTFYGLAVGMSYQNFSPQDNFKGTAQIDSVVTGVLCHTFSGELNGGGDLPAPDLKSNFAKATLCHADELIIKSSITKYCNLSLNHFIKLKKRDRLFPFHYFW
ncbi:hypothetical protein [Fulvivirga ligni]|uniref:hypothetical protein n=1 Tax=Fulvivirga ligni TaxID=2904246 RepID=UPI001F2FEEF8|nr:hypothetical protein [Fulvivirga ligni]UII19109.1 hypothetical protein LVD16_14790 [Fulvivirga ligni]